MKTDYTAPGAPGSTRALALIVRGTMALACAFALAACDETGGGNSCARDEDCPRGTICQDDACTEVPCNAIGECPGSGRTCLFDLRMCSPQECASIDRACQPGQTCVEAGPFRSTCLDADGLACTVDAECAALGGAFRCCEGVCSDACQEQDAIVVVDMSPPDGGDTDGAPPADGGMSDAGPPEPDMARPMGGELCAACGRSEDCEALGPGAECTPIGNSGSFCTSACATPQDCPAGYNCLDAVGQCIPANFNCETCPATPCDDGLVCDVQTGECGPPRQVCESCTGEDCAPGLECAQAGGAPVCLADCAGGGNCPAGYTCDGALCQPDGGACDACNGQCAPPTPVCLQDQGRCVECDAVTPCAQDGQVCDLGSNTCQDEGADCACVQDRDCEACLGLPICFRGSCVACLEDADCPPRFACSDNNQCIRAPCAGVACQQGAQCDPQTGTCVNGMGGIACQGPQDCAVPDGMSCNQMTGQCFYNDGTCDPPGGDGVCPPGSNCSINPFLMTSSCTCKKVDPIGMPFGPDLIPCHPGGVCFHGEFPPGSGMAPEEGFCAQFGM